MKYKHILFDVDGTLVDNESAVINTWQQTIEELLGKHFEKNELDFVLGIPGVTTMQKLGIENPDKAFELWNRNFQKHRSEMVQSRYLLTFKKQALLRQPVCIQETLRMIVLVPPTLTLTSLWLPGAMVKRKYLVNMNWCILRMF